METAWAHLTRGTSALPEALPVVMGGSISQKADGWPALVASLVDADIPVRVTVAAMPPVFGAVVEARKQTADGEGADFTAIRTAFSHSFSL
jgi:hypothetical protein